MPPRLFLGRCWSRSCWSRACRRGLVRFGRGWRFRDLDLGPLAQIRDIGQLRLLHDIAAHLVLDLIESWRGLLAFVQDFDEMPAEWALHRIGHLADVELES